MKNAFKKNILLSSFLVVIVVTIISFSIMLTYENNQRNKLFEDYLQLEQQIVLDDVYTQYLIDNKNNECDVLKNQLKSQFEISNNLLAKLKKINKTGVISSDNKIKYTYILVNIKLWLHYNKLINDCNYNRNLVVYFYPETTNLSNKDAAIMDAKTKVFELELDNLKSNKNLSVLALPYQNSMPILNQIINDYNIVNAPSIIYKNDIYYDLNVLN